MEIVKKMLNNGYKRKVRGRMDTKVYSLIVLLQFIKLEDLDRIIYESNCTDEVLERIKAHLKEQTNEK